jgi:flagellar hook assembly protein FlgD
MAASGGATHWTVTITNAASAVVRSFAGAGASLNVTWNGADNAGARVPDGIYRLMMAEIDNAGNAVVRGYMVTVDTTPALYTVAVSPVRFSPDGDGVADTSRLSWSASEPVTGVVRILKGTTVIRSWPVTARGSWAVAWDGRNASGVRVGDGTYTFGVDARDAAGNRRIASTTVTIDRTAGWLRWSRSFFPQDNDALVPTAVLSYRLARTAATSLGIYDASGTLVRTVWTGQSQPAGTRTWTWNGKLANGSYVAQGLYRAVLTVTSGLGTTVLSRPVWVTGFAIGPSATTVVAGQRLTVNFSSIEPLSTRPVVALVQPGRAAVYVTATRLTNGSYRAVFTIQTGPAGPATITVSAKDSSGRRNTTQIGIKVAS